MITPTARPALGRVMATARDMRADAWAGPVCVAVAAGLMIFWTWGTWPDVLIDFGREA